MTPTVDRDFYVDLRIHEDGRVEALLCGKAHETSTLRHSTTIGKAFRVIRASMRQVAKELFGDTSTTGRAIAPLSKRDAIGDLESIRARREQMAGERAVPSEVSRDSGCRGGSTRRGSGANGHKLRGNSRATSNWREVE